MDGKYEEAIRAHERERIAQGVWDAIQPLASWVAGVNTERLNRGGESDE
jgi:hypothetical protein